MHFKITYNNGAEHYVRSKSKAQAAEIKDRLNRIKLGGKIKRFDELKFKLVKPDDIEKS